MRARFLRVYHRLLAHHGPQHWWPGDTPFEVMVGAVLTQNTSWTNVEKAIVNLKRHGLLDAHALAGTPAAELARLLTPVGYFNVKARRLHNFCRWFLAQGGQRALARRRTAELRRDLLAVNGIGPETADDILLYAFHRDVFVIDAYTRRIFVRLGLAAGDETYEVLRRRFEEVLKPAPGGAAGRRAAVRLFNEYHALIVIHGKDGCRPRPRCEGCCLRRMCPQRAV